MFYKNVLYVIPIWIFGFSSSFSATAIYNMWLYQLYNVVFTALPIMWFAVFDWEHDKAQFLSDPKLYRVGLDDVFFSSSVFWRWFSYAVLQGVLLAVAVFVTMDSATETHGQIGGLTIDGNFMFCALVIIVNVKVLISSYQHSFWSLFLIFGSIISFFIVFAGMSEMIITSVYGEFDHTYNLIQTYLLLLFFTLAYVLMDEGL
jgi:magnesium-transporting ATPase (P-type)